MPPRLRPRQQLPDNDSTANYFVYHGRENQAIPHDVTHVKVHSSVRRIWDYTFYHRTSLLVVILNDGLEEIGRCAFRECLSLLRINIPNSVKKIDEGGFHSCYLLETVTLGSGLKDICPNAFCRCRSLISIRIPNSVRTIQGCAFSHCRNLTAVTMGRRVSWIGAAAFSHCSSLEEIVIPNLVKEIEPSTFFRCSRLRTVNLGNRVESISFYAFRECTSLVRIVIPCSVGYISENAFLSCANLEQMVFGDEIQNFVSCDAMQEWWNSGVHERSLPTFMFLVRRSIPRRFPGISMISSAKILIHEKLGRIPTVDGDSLAAYFDTIHSEISAYEIFMLQSSTMFPNQFGLDYYCLVLNILSFL